MSIRLLTDTSMLRCDRVSGSASTGEALSSASSRAVMADGLRHSKAGKATDEEDWRAAWIQVSQLKNTDI